jgi:fructosamine-3-kinase
MMIPSAVSAWFSEQGYGRVVSSSPVGGGCINNGARIKTTSGPSFFLKTNRNAPADMFACEAQGLEALRVEDGPRVPRAFLWGREFLLLEDLAPAPKQKGYWQDFGHQLAALHNHTNDRFGFDQDNYIGSTSQPNPWTEDSFDFFAQHRLGYQAQLAAKRGLLSSAEADQVAQLAGRLPELVPAQPASLIHGDLWGGNAITGSEGEPALIDPAAHYGWAEAELGMTTLFGGFSNEFYQAYEEVRPLEPGWRDRLKIYNLYHLLNHLNLFGRGYYGQVMGIVRKYA